MIRREKKLESILFFYDRFEQIWFKRAFDPKNYGF
jgi:hypothetical protein